MKAKAEVRGSNVVLLLPLGSQIGPELHKLIKMNNFIRTHSMQQITFRYLFSGYHDEDYYRAKLAAQHMADCFNTGKKEYCKELLFKRGIKHG